MKQMRIALPKANDFLQKLNGKKLLEAPTKGFLCGENNSSKKMQILGNRFVQLAVCPMTQALTG